MGARTTSSLSRPQAASSALRESRPAPRASSLGSLSGTLSARRGGPEEARDVRGTKDDVLLPRRRDGEKEGAALQLLHDAAVTVLVALHGADRPWTLFDDREACKPSRMQLASDSTAQFGAGLREAFPRGRPIAGREAKRVAPRGRTTRSVHFRRFAATHGGWASTVELGPKGTSSCPADASVASVSRWWTRT